MEHATFSHNTFSQKERDNWNFHRGDVAPMRFVFAFDWHFLDQHLGRFSRNYEEVKLNSSGK